MVSRPAVTATCAAASRICLDGGFVRDVYSSLPTLHVVIVDWDVADTIIDWSQLTEDPKVLTVETQRGEVHAAVREADVTPISDAVGTDLEAVVIAAREQDFLSADVPLRFPPTTNVPENTLASLVAEATAQGVSSEDLDEAVHDTVSGLVWLGSDLVYMVGVRSWLWLGSDLVYTIRGYPGTCGRAGSCANSTKPDLIPTFMRRAGNARPHLEQARRTLNLTTPLQLDCDVSFDEQDDGQPQVSVTAKFFTERQPSGYSGWSYGDELRIEFRILLAEMADEGDEPREAWEALQNSRQQHQQQTELLITWRKKIAEIPYVQRQAKAHLTDVLLQQTEPGRQLYQSLQQQFQEFCQGVPVFCEDSLSA